MTQNDSFFSKSPVGVDLDFISKMEATQAPCTHLSREESLKEIIEHLQWKIKQLETDLDDTEYEISFWPDYVGKWFKYEALAVEKKKAEQEITTCTKMIHEQRKKGKFENCITCFL